jgi:hypothetical protein
VRAGWRLHALPVGLLTDMVNLQVTVRCNEGMASALMNALIEELNK